MSRAPRTHGLRVRIRPLWRQDRGSAVAEFALVTPLLLLVGLAVIQLVLVLHVRSTLTAAAAEGARAAALSGSHLRAGEQRTQETLANALGGGSATSVIARYVTLGDAPAIQVSIRARLPLFGMLGPDSLVVTGHALRERG